MQRRKGFPEWVGILALSVNCLLAGCAPRALPTTTALPETKVASATAVATPAPSSPTWTPPLPPKKTPVYTATHASTPAPTLKAVHTATATALPTPTSEPTPSPMPSATPAVCTVLADVLNVRNGPGTEYQVVGRVRQGDALQPLGRNAAGDWLWVSLEGGGHGWVYAGLVEYRLEAGQLAIQTPPAPPMATASPAATSTSVSTVPAFQYVPAGPASADLSHPCPGCPLAPVYIIGQVRDAGGNPLPGVRLICYNDWHRYPVVVSKGSGVYDFPIIQATTVWYVMVVNEDDQPISPAAAVSFDMSVACRYVLDWVRTY